MEKSRREPSFQFRADKDRRQVAVMHCYVCNAEGTVVSSNGLNPTHVAEIFEHKGWAADPWNKRKCLCPEHNPKKRSRQTTIIEAMRTTAMEHTNTPRVTPAESARTLDKVQRQKVRGLVDDHFDDERGAYATGWSDQRIGKEVQVPWGLVTQLREAAYGPILVDPETEALRAAIEANHAEIKVVEKQLEATIDKLGACRRTADSLLERLETIAAARTKRA